VTVGTAAPVLKPLKLTCTQSDCDNDLHCFLQKTQKHGPRGGPCRSCGKDLVDFSRVQARDPKDVEHTIEALSHEWIRHEFWHRPFDLRSMNHARRKGMRIIRTEYAAKRIRQAVGKARHPREGRQTPYEGNVVSYAQHAVAACCRRCIEYWHGIPMGTPLSDEHVDFLAQLVILYLGRRLPALNEDPVKVPPIRKAKPTRRVMARSPQPGMRKAGSRTLRARAG
jgi:hypothetical protein